MIDMLCENDSTHCAMFAHVLNGEMYVAVKSEKLDIETDEQSYALWLITQT